MKPVARRRPSRVLLALLAIGLAASGCASGGGDSDDSGSTAGFSDLSRGDAPAEMPADRDAMERGMADESMSFGETENRVVDGMDLAGTALYGESPESRPDDGSTDRKIIAKGNVSLESDDVELTITKVVRITDELGGEITERETTTNDEGDLRTARLLLRIPVGGFTDAIAELEDAGDLISSNTGAEDVTTQVIDTKVRIRAQRRSLARVEALLDRAQSISDIIRIEGQLTRRQANLDSLVQRLDYLSNQTSMSTITVNVALPPKKKEKEEPKEKEKEEVGFVAGLEDGWKSFKSFGTDVLTLSGRVLPFAGVLLLVGGPLLILVRRFRRPTGTTAADA
ncbi:DUF4349 domain-containing protein [Nocardioides stalactiti]|uniref:DUF4349 domain-containing protein n=1 Tax=Nocardioides stalactiti TaxID=2755356 RepID=UPI0016021755|nr:DUF4349 domain-containing protein [Nocardioides stalactiti]